MSSCQEVNSQLANDTTPPVSSGFETLFPDASALASECARSLVFTADLILGRIARLLRPFDVSPASGLVLSILGDSEEPLAPHEIAERLIVSRATVTGLIDSLESREYVRRRAHPTDRRMLQVEITEKGRRAADEFRPIVQRHHRKCFQALDGKEQKRLVEFLERIQDSLREPEM